MEENLKNFLKSQGFYVKQQIGYGLTSNVYHCPHDKGVQYALKRIPHKDQHKQRTRLQTELQMLLLRDLSHPGIVQMKEAKQFVHETHLFLEYCPHGSMNELQKILSKNKEINEIKQKISSYYLGQIANVLLYLKNVGIVHRDIKMENFVFTHDYKLKLIDFGSCKPIQIEEFYLDGKILTIDEKLSANKSLIGSKHYFAPQMVGSKHQRKITFQLDVWSFGVLAYRLLCGQFPFVSRSEGNSELFQKIRQTQPIYPETLTQNQKQFLVNCFEKNPDKRITIEEVIKLPLFQQFKNKNIYQIPCPLDKILNPNHYEEKQWLKVQCRIKEGQNGSFKLGAISIIRGEDGRAYMRFAYTSKKAPMINILLEEIRLQKERKDGLKFEKMTDNTEIFGKFSDQNNRDMIVELGIQLLKQ